jgi:hypothetical protein
VTRSARLIALAAFGALLLPAAAPALDLIDDWRKVGPPDAENPPHAKGLLSAAAAEKLVASIDRAWRSGQPLRARGDRLEWVLDNLRYFQLGADGEAAPPAAGPADTRLRERERLRQVQVLGVRGAGGHALLLLQAAVAYDESGDVYTDATFGCVLAADGSVRDVAVLTWGWGDGGYIDGRTASLGGRVLTVADVTAGPGELCELERVQTEDGCMVPEGQDYDLEVDRAGRFTEGARRRISLTGQFVDPATDEELRVDDDGAGAVRVAYRGKRKANWRSMKVVSADRKGGVIKAKFQGAVTYTLTLAGDGRSLVSAGSDGSKPQRFGWIPPARRYERNP